MAKKPGAGGIMVVAVILGLITAYLIWSYLRKAEEKNRSNWKPVVVAVVDIKPRTKITRDMIKLEQAPRELIAETSATKIEDVENRLAAKDINAKAQIRGTDLVTEGQAPTLAFKVPEGMRAIAVGGDEVKFVGTSIQPGDRVDVLARYQDPRTRQELTKMILQNVLVLAVNRGVTESGGKEGANSSMTLAVKPEETELIAAADGAGALRFSLRSVQDNKMVQSEGVTARDLAIGAKGSEEATSPSPAPAATPQAATSTPERTTIFIGLPAATQRRPEWSIIKGSEEKTIAP
jgi:pilus assembly protein CpaB